MAILRNLLTPFQAEFSDTRLGGERSHWFIFILLAGWLAIIVPFTSSMSSYHRPTIWRHFKAPKMGSRTVLRMGVFSSFRNGGFRRFWERPRGEETLALQDQSIGAVA